MKFSGTDVMAVGVIAMGGVVGLAFSIAINDGNASTNTFTVSTDFETAQTVVVGERVERIRTDASGVYVERHRERHDERDEHRGDRHAEEEMEFGGDRDEATGATVIRIRGDAEATPRIDVRVREDHRVRFNSATSGPEPLIYVDGERFEGDFDTLDPDDIERIEVVKGAAALELFGEDATGGVIQIFMKNAPARNPGR